MHITGSIAFIGLFLLMSFAAGIPASAQSASDYREVSDQVTRAIDDSGLHSEWVKRQRSQTRTIRTVASFEINTDEVGAVRSVSVSSAENIDPDILADITQLLESQIFPNHPSQALSYTTEWTYEVLKNPWHDWRYVFVFTAAVIGAVAIAGNLIN